MTERNMVNLTITMTKEERKALKQLALDKRHDSFCVNPFMVAGTTGK